MLVAEDIDRLGAIRDLVSAGGWVGADRTAAGEFAWSLAQRYRAGERHDERSVLVTLHYALLLGPDADAQALRQLDQLLERNQQ